MRCSPRRWTKPTLGWQAVNRPLTVEEHGSGQRLAGLALVQPGVHAPTQLHALQPVQDEEGALDAAKLAQRNGQAVLAGVAAELAQHQRCRDGALLDGGGQAQDVVPVGADGAQVQPLGADRGFQGGVARLALRDEQFRVGEVADARREAQAQQMHQAEDVVGEAGGVGVVLLDAQVRLVIQQPVQDIGRVAHADVDHLGAEGRVLVADVGVEGAAWVGAVLRVDVAGALGVAAGLKALPVR